MNILDISNARPYISEATARKTQDAFGRLFATTMLLGDQVDLVFWRDPEMDGIGVSVGPQRVLMVLAGTQTDAERSQASAFVGADGEFRKAAPFDVRPGDVFTVRGITGEIKAVLPVTGGVARAAFVLKS
jgi:hypothetical protein